MRKQQRIIFWIALGLLIFALFRWLFGIAMPEIALPFSIGITVVLISGLLCGRAVIAIVLKANPGNLSRIIGLLAAFIFIGFIIIAASLHAMIGETTFLPFSLTVFFLFLVTASIGALVTILRHQYKTKVLSAQIAMTQSKNELQLLQAQLSPHFLFNTLNNLYGLSLTDSAKVPPLLLKLSELLRYSVYDVKDVYVPLQSEADYLRNYIEFERIRLGDRLLLQLDMDHAFNSWCKIPPLLLVVFVENAFKHSRNTHDEKVHIAIQLQATHNSITFSVRNSCAEEEHLVSDRTKHSGFGLESVRKRLELLYNGKHELNIERGIKEYAVQLTLHFA